MRTLAVLMIVIVLGGSVLAQDAPAANMTEVNRANELAYIKLVRNEQMPELVYLLFAPEPLAFNPFNTAGVTSNRDQSVADEIYFQSAYTYKFTESLVLAEGDLTGVYVYQVGEMVGEYFGTPPTGEQSGGMMLYVDRYDDGLIAETYTAWDQAGFLEGLGWASVDYPDFDLSPWGLTLSSTSSTPADHHAVLDALYANFCEGCTPDFAATYASDVVVHDYMQVLEGVDAVAAEMGKVTGLTGLKVGKQLAVCEGDMCISYLILNFTQGEEAKDLIWASAHRFEDGKIAEEWWQYDNSVLWPAIGLVQ
ncbi:MAG: nuclear transport factor 2 family protein [Anaerolineae bacterium]|nr:nuclear transport factor 2 family protein [Anaerolineae bacterium]